MSRRNGACQCCGCALCGRPREHFTITVSGLSLCPGFSGIPSGTFVLTQNGLDVPFRPLCDWQNYNVGAGSVGTACGFLIGASGHHVAQIGLATGFGPPVQLSVSIFADFFNAGGLFDAIVPLSTAQAMAFCRNGMSGIANQHNPADCCAGFGGHALQGGYGGTIDIVPGP